MDATSTHQSTPRSPLVNRARRKTAPAPGPSTTPIAVAGAASTVRSTAAFRNVDEPPTPTDATRPATTRR